MPDESLVSFTSHKILFLNTLAFTVCFAAWMLNGVLVTYLTDNGIFEWSMVQIGWLLGVPVLTGSLFRLPIGILTDRIGGKWVFGILLLFCSVPMFLLSQANSYSTFLLLSFLFGMAGTSFAVGVGYTSVWYPKSWQGRAIGIFGMGSAGASLTTLIGPSLLNNLTAGGANPEGWRQLPVIYAGALLAMAILFLIFAQNKKPVAAGKSLQAIVMPLTQIRVWRFGLYYFLLFGCFVTFSQWLVPYFVNVYQTDLILAGLLASTFSLPAGLFRAVGGFLSDKYGARKVMYGVLGCSVILSFFLIIPRMEISSPGSGVMATSAGTVTSVSDTAITVNNKTYPVTAKSNMFEHVNRKALVFPAKESWHEVLVKPGDKVTKKQLLAQGTTRIYFKANMWVFIGLVMFIGMAWGIGTAAVFKHIPEYFPTQIGLVGGMVGLIGGLGGFVGPILFGYLLSTTGLWTSSWMFVLLLSIICLVWMHLIITRMMNRSAPDLADKFEHPH
ncbi:MFS transporter [Adhaeribacter rhizoryzae]|uniref:NarK/NasA family nitrate transporter n=1 Tax=Adhaeribacter rhizoryzae TaxID=2607907 RepID=A0A5M6D109_9BACT|nr:MFS transporter [Adhaeribacter rhizoryzae]KAA5539972.1 NarK/NasA family nitrate transporter [Adhaeribacter rhizoryzae]